MSNSKSQFFNQIGIQGVLFSVLLAIVLMAPKYLFFGTLGYAVLTFVYNRFTHKKFEFKPFYWAYIIFYLLFAIMLLWTDDMRLGTRDLEFKLMFFAIPPVMALSNWKEKDLFSLNIGFNIVIFFCLKYAFETYLNCYDPINGCFAHQRNSGNVHPTYMAMFSVTALLISMYYVLFKRYDWSKIKKILWYGFLILMIGMNALYIIMVDSKAGILSMVIGPGLMVMTWIWIRFSRRHFIIAIVACGVVLTAGMVRVLTQSEFKGGLKALQSYFADRDEFIKENCLYLESNTARIMVWDSSFQLLKDHPFGVGAGDVSHELINQYKKEDLEGVLRRQLNPHSQFFHTSLALGIPGFITLVYLFFYGLVKGVRRKYSLLFVFSALIIFNSLFESILDLQVGIFYFVFFSLIFEQLSRNKELT